MADVIDLFLYNKKYAIPYIIKLKIIQYLFFRVFKQIK